MLKDVLTALTNCSVGENFLHCRGLMRDNFAIEYYGRGDKRNVLLRLRLRGNPRTRRTIIRLQVIIRDVFQSKTE